MTWSRKVTANCIGGVTHSATQIVSCECAEADWTYTVSPLTCPESGRKTKVWGGKKSTSNCEGGFFPPPDSETVNCTYLGGSTGGIYAPPDTATCTDNIQNGAETAVDCGGSCPACGGSKLTPTTPVTGDRALIAPNTIFGDTTGGVKAP